MNRRSFLEAALAGASVVAMGGAGLSKPAAFPDPKGLRVKLEALRQEMLVPGAGVLVRSAALGKWKATFGQQARGHSVPYSDHNHFRIGSCTKTWTGTVILQLVDEKKLKLSDPVSKYRGDVPNGGAITLENLLTMRSGLYNYSEALVLNESLDKTPQRVFSPEELLALAFKQPAYFAPGQGYHYSNTNFVLMGLMIEKLTGQSLQDAFEARIFRRLGLSQTSLPPSQTANLQPAPYARGYQYGSNVATLTSEVLPPDVQARAKSGALAPIDFTDASTSWCWAAGGGISTLDDLATYVRAMTRGGLLSPATQKLRLASPVAVNPAMPEVGYGLALAKFADYYGHTGEMPGYNTFMGHDPKRDITVVTATTLNAAVDGRATANTMARMIIAHLA